MREVSLKEAQNLMKTILRDVDAICRKNNIEYWIESGTLLGAVRHGGFIPWDDDIDVGMKREDYIKFSKIIKEELPGDLIYENILENERVNYSWTKIRHKESQILESENDSNSDGMFIDIFPYDFYEEKCILEKEKNKNIFKIKTVYNSELKYEKDIRKNVKRAFCKIYNKVVLRDNMRTIRQKCVKNARDNEIIEKKYIGYGTEVDLFSNKYLTEEIFPTKDIVFEDIIVKGPNKEQAILKKLYGNNYMSIPKIEDRYSHNIGLYIGKERT
ncbi:MAG: LicD family protein [Clostridium sp.]|uniref:LicD family protein n=1 Tax=Clostridium sp. TaxID=1506 RepID=UPI003F3F874D